MSAIAYVALWIFVFSVPWEQMLILPGVSIVAKATGATALGLTLLTVIISGRLRRWHLFHVAALLFWVCAGIELLLFHSGVRLPFKFWTYGQLILAAWMIWELAQSEARQRGLLLAYVLGAYVAAVDTILLYRRKADALKRFAAGGADANDIAMVLALALPMAWYLGMTHKRPIVRWICRAYVPVAVVAIGLTGSRGGMITTTVALLFVPLSMTKLSPGRMVTAMVMLGAAGVLAVAYTPETLIERLATTRAEVEGRSFGGRWKLWRAGLAVFPEDPWLGTGTGGYKTAITPILGPAAQVAHNSYLSVLVEQGLVGFVLYMTMIAAVIGSILRLPMLERRFALVTLATLSIAMLPLTWEDRRAVWVIWSMLLALAHAVRQRPVPGGEPSARVAGSVARRALAAGPVGRTAVLRGRSAREMPR
jgi:O-antigen ligase